MRMRSASYATTPKTADMTTPVCSPKKPVTATRVPKFLRCLYDILHTEDQAILAWSKDGSHFQIFNTARLETEILPKYFKHGKFASFQRQLNNFGFRKWTKTQSNVCTFSHHHYVRRQPQQLVELVALLNETTVAKPESPMDKPQTPGIHNGKRKRTESASEGSKTNACKAIKREPTTTQRPTNLSLSTMDPTSFDFEFESWSMMADIHPLKWATKSRLAIVKSESGNETPTSASGFADGAFDFTLEELDDLLLTNTHVECVNDDDDQVSTRLVNEWYGVEPPMAWNDGQELFGKAELEMYMQDTEAWANH